MRKALIIVFILAISVSLAWAQGGRPFETRDEARQRHSAERYETYKNHGYQAPLGGYSEPLGDPAPWGTDKPGFVSPGQGQSSLYGPSPGHGRHGFGSLDED
jgi:hypothetical protein